MQFDSSLHQLEQLNKYLLERQQSIEKVESIKQKLKTEIQDVSDIKIYKSVLKKIQAKDDEKKLIEKRLLEVIYSTFYVTHNEKRLEQLQFTNSLLQKITLELLKCWYPEKEIPKSYFNNFLDFFNYFQTFNSSFKLFDENKSAKENIIYANIVKSITNISRQKLRIKIFQAMNQIIVIGENFKQKNSQVAFPIINRVSRISNQSMHQTKPVQSYNNHTLEYATIEVEQNLNEKDQDKDQGKNMRKWKDCFSPISDLQLDQLMHQHIICKCKYKTDQKGYLLQKSGGTFHHWNSLVQNNQEIKKTISNWLFQREQLNVSLQEQTILDIHENYRVIRKRKIQRRVLRRMYPREENNTQINLYGTLNQDSIDSKNQNSFNSQIIQEKQLIQKDNSPSKSPLKQAKISCKITNVNFNNTNNQNKIHTNSIKPQIRSKSHTKDNQKKKLKNIDIYGSILVFDRDVEVKRDYSFYQYVENFQFDH